MNATTTTAPARCPDCGATLVIDPTAQVGSVVYCQRRGAMPTLERRRRPATVAFCSGCEYAVELVKGRR